jgi:ketosteroid isomerase-like protein
MSQENLELVRRAFEEFNRGGVEAMVDTFWHPQIVYDMTPAGIPGFGVYTGYEEVRGLFADWFAAFEFDEWQLEVDELFDRDERVVVMARQHGPGSSSGADVGLKFVQVLTLSPGKIVRVDNYLDRGQALEAAGLSE